MVLRRPFRPLMMIALAAMFLAWTPRAQAQAQFNVTVSPGDHLTMSAGSQQTITVNTQPNASTPASADSIVYNLQITPDFAGGGPIYTDAPKTTTKAAGWPPVQLTITVPLGTPAGMYSGPLTGHYQYSPGNYTDYEFDVIFINVVAPTPGFSFDVTPTNDPTVSTTSPATLTFTTHPDPGFNSPITYSFSPSVSFLSVSPQSTTINSPYSPFNIVISANGSDPSFAPGTYPVNVVASGGSQTYNHTLNVTVTAPPQDYTVTAIPSTFTITEGGTQAVQFTAAGTNGFNGPITITAPAAPAHTTISPASITITPGGLPQQFTITTEAGAPSSTLTFVATATVNGAPLQKQVVVSMNVTPAAQADFAIIATPLQSQVGIGGQTQIRFNATAINGFTGTIQVAPQNAPAGVTFNPPTVSLTPGGFATMNVLVGPTAAPGPVTLTFSATSGTIQHTATAQLQLVSVNAAAPTITSITPPGLARGAAATTVRLGGTNFAPGAVVFSDSPSIVVQRTIVISPTLADVVLLARADTDLHRPYQLKLRNTNGLETAQGATIFVYDQDAIGAPLGVRAAAIVSPVEGSLMAGVDSVYARGLIATTGSGILHGQWLLDGIAFESFEVNAQAGMPVEVRSRVPVPATRWGDHDLTLAVATRLEDLAPGSQTATVSPAVRLISTIETATKLTILDPPNRVIIRRTSIPTFRWTLVPGAAGYRIEIGTPETPAQARFDTPDAEWTPTLDDLKRIGHGIFTWRVRALFPGNVLGEPTEPRAIVILPEAVSLQKTESRDGEVAWKGGSPGVLYHVVLRAPHGDGTLFDAFTVRQSYHLPRALRGSVASAQITPVALDLRPLGAPIAIALPAATRAAADQTTQQPAIDVAPAEGSNVTTTQPVISATWSTPVATQDVSLFIDTTDVTPVSDVTSTSITYNSILPLDPGAHTARLAAAGTTRSWTFTVAGDASATAPQPATASSGAPAVNAGPAPAMAATTPARTDYTLAPNGTINWIHGGSGDGHVQLSGQGDIAKASGTGTKFTGDLAWHADDDPSMLRQESRNYVVRGAARQGKVGEEATLGYITPDFTMGAEYLTSGLARTGGVGKVTTPIGSISYYQPISTAIHGVLSANDLNLRIRSVAFTTPAQKKFQLGLIGLEVKDPGSVDTNGERLRTFGVFSTWNVSPAAALTFEFAHGSTRANCSEDLLVACQTEARHGNAARFGLVGNVKGTTYGVMLRHTDANFVNPANRGFTIGGVSDRNSLDLNLARQIGRSYLSATARRSEDARSHDSTSPRAHQTGLNLAWSMQVGRHLNVNSNANWSQDRAEASPTFFLPRTSRDNGGISFTFNEPLPRGFMVSESLSYSDSRDHENPLSNQKTSSANLTFGGSIVRNVTFSTNAGATRSEGAATMGTTNQYLLSIQPMFAIPSTFLSFQPRVAYNRSTNDLSGLTSNSQQYSAILQISPPWVSSLLSGQISADWNRSSMDQLGLSYQQSTHQYQAALNLRWGGLHAGSAYAAPSILPGAVPMAAGASQAGVGAVSH